MDDECGPALAEHVTGFRRSEGRVDGDECDAREGAAAFAEKRPAAWKGE